MKAGIEQVLVCESGIEQVLVCEGLGWYVKAGIEQVLACECRDRAGPGV